MTTIAPPGAKPGEFPTLGFDPAPGQPSVVDTTSQKITGVANELGEIRDALRNVAVVDGIWEGMAAQAFAGVAEPLPKQADEIAQALNEAGGLLTGWEGSLGDYQQRAKQLETDAAAAKKELDQARNDPALDLAGKHFSDDESLREAQARYDAAVQDVRMWEGRLQEIRDQARTLLGRHQDEADRIAGQIDKIIEDTRGLLDRLGDAVGDVIDAIGDFAGDVWGWVQENAEFIKNIGDAFGAISTVLGAAAVTVAAIAPFTGPAAPVLGGVATGLGVASAATSGVALGAHGIAKAAGADVGWDTLGIDALGVASLGVGKVASKGVALGYDAFVVGAGAGSAGGDLVDDLGTYWLPDSGGEAALGAVTPAGLAVWNAWEESQETNG